MTRPVSLRIAKILRALSHDAIPTSELTRFVRVVAVIQVLQERKYHAPFVIAVRINSRTEAVVLCERLFIEMRRCIQEDYDLDQTIDWWSRPLHDAGHGYLTIGFRPCDIREML